MPKPVNPTNFNRVPIADEKNEITRLTAENQKLASLSSDTQKQVQNLSKDNTRLTADISRITQEFEAFKQQVSNESFLRANPTVQKILAEQQKTDNVTIRRLQSDTLKLQKEIEILTEKISLTKVTPLLRQEFNTFLKDSVMELQNELSQTEGDYEFVVREVEVEAVLAAEARGGKMAYILPTSDQLQEVDGSKLQKLKYKLSMIPKE